MRELYVLDTNVLIYATNKDSIYFEVSRRFILDNNVHGKHVFDAQLAAVAISNGVSSIVTFNARDFKMFSDIKIIVPS